MNSTAKPNSRLSASICCRISRCTTTSSAVVGSSMMISSGLSERAIAMITRWRMPPESSCGYDLRRRSSMPTCSRSSPARVRARRLLILSCARMVSTNWSPTRISGLSAFIALWKTIDTLRQRYLRSSSAFLPISSSPRNRTLPPTIRPGGFTICRMAFATVVLPQPDSPARPRTSPSLISRSMPSIARAGRSTPYSTVSLRSSSKASVAGRVAVGTTEDSARAVTRPPRRSGRPGRRRAPRPYGSARAAASFRSGASDCSPRRFPQARV